MKQRPSPLFLPILLLLLSAALTAFVKVQSSYRQAAFDVCDLVDAHYYRSRDGGVRAWLKACRSYADEQPFVVGRDETIAAINDLLGALAVSHLSLYTPVANRAIWDHQAVDTGLRARMVDGYVIVYEVIEGSAGQKAGIQEGDVVVAINGEEVVADDVEALAGSYTIRRQDKERRVVVAAEPLTVDLRPQLELVDEGVVRLRLQSFLGRYFEREDWVKVAEALPRFRHVIIDLRGNAGGSFPAMLRALSAFRCEPIRVGTIYQPKNNKTGQERSLADELDTVSQLEQLEGVAKLHLNTFKGYPCYSGNVTVLVDQGTSSVSEIFAESFIGRPKSRVWGLPTAGQVVMAQWFPMHSLGDGDFSMSIPIAGYRTMGGAEIEDEGITPERFLYYDLERATQGLDAWIEEAADGAFERAGR